MRVKSPADYLTVEAYRIPLSSFYGTTTLQPHAEVQIQNAIMIMIFDQRILASYRFLAAFVMILKSHSTLERS